MFLFIHIHKTAGSSAIHMMQGSFGDSVLTQSGIAIPHPVEVSSKYNAVLCHCYYGFRWYLPQDTQVATLLRSPVDRLKSLYEHARRNPKHHLRTIASGTFLEFGQHIEFPDIDNSYSRIFCGYTHDLNYDTLNRVTNTHYQAARHNLIHNVTVGITEHFSESMVMFRGKFGLHYHPTLTDGVADYPAVVDEEREIISDINIYDEMLYAEQLRIFRETVLNE